MKELLESGILTGLSYNEDNDALIGNVKDLSVAIKENDQTKSYGCLIWVGRKEGGDSGELSSYLSEQVADKPHIIKHFKATGRGAAIALVKYNSVSRNVSNLSRFLGDLADDLYAHDYMNCCYSCGRTDDLGYYSNGGAIVQYCGSCAAGTFIAPLNNSGTAAVRAKSEEAAAAGEAVQTAPAESVQADAAVESAPGTDASIPAPSAADNAGDERTDAPAEENAQSVQAENIIPAAFDAAVSDKKDPEDLTALVESEVSGNVQEPGTADGAKNDAAAAPENAGAEVDKDVDDFAKFISTGEMAPARKSIFDAPKNNGKEKQTEKVNDKDADDFAKLVATGEVGPAKKTMFNTPRQENEDNAEDAAKGDEEKQPDAVADDFAKFVATGEIEPAKTNMFGALRSEVEERIAEAAAKAEPEKPDAVAEDFARLVNGDQPVPEKPAEQPVPEKPAEQPVPEKPAEQPAPEKPAEQPVPEKPAEQPAPEKPAEQPAPDKPAEEPVPEKPAEQPAPEMPSDDAQSASGDAVAEDFAKFVATGEVGPAKKTIFSKPDERPAVSDENRTPEKPDADVDDFAKFVATGEVGPAKKNMFNTPRQESDEKSADASQSDEEPKPDAVADDFAKFVATGEIEPAKTNMFGAPITEAEEKPADAARAEEEKAPDAVAEDFAKLVTAAETMPAEKPSPAKPAVKAKAETTDDLANYIALEAARQKKESRQGGKKKKKNKNTKPETLGDLSELVNKDSSRPSEPVENKENDRPSEPEKDLRDKELDAIAELAAASVASAAPADDNAQQENAPAENVISSDGDTADLSVLMASENENRTEDAPAQKAEGHIISTDGDISDLSGLMASENEGAVQNADAGSASADSGNKAETVISTDGDSTDLSGLMASENEGAVQNADAGGVSGEDGDKAETVISTDGDSADLSGLMAAETESDGTAPAENVISTDGDISDLSGLMAAENGVESRTEMSGAASESDEDTFGNANTYNEDEADISGGTAGNDSSSGLVFGGGQSGNPDGAEEVVTEITAAGAGSGEDLKFVVRDDDDEAGEPLEVKIDDDSDEGEDIEITALSSDINAPTEAKGEELKAEETPLEADGSVPMVNPNSEALKNTGPAGSQRGDVRAFAFGSYENANTAEEPVRYDGRPKGYHGADPRMGDEMGSVSRDFTRQQAALSSPDAPKQRPTGFKVVSKGSTPSKPGTVNYSGGYSNSSKPVLGVIAAVLFGIIGCALWCGASYLLAGADTIGTDLRSVLVSLCGCLPAIAVFVGYRIGGDCFDVKGIVISAILTIAMDIVGCTATFVTDELYKKTLEYGYGIPIGKAFENVQKAFADPVLGGSLTLRLWISVGIMAAALIAAVIIAKKRAEKSDF